MSEDQLATIDALLAIIDMGSFGGAARMLGLTQSTISRRIAQLEGRLGVRLLARTTRHVSLTPSGEAFAEQARRAISLLRGAEAELGAGETIAAGLVRITAPTAFGRACLVPVLAELTEAHPALQIDLDLSDRYLDLQSSGVDLAIRLSDDAPSGWMSVDLGAVPVRLCASPAYIAKHGVPVTPDQIAAHRLLAAKTYTARTKWSFRWKGRLQHLDISPFFIVSDFTALAALVRAGVGISALPAYLSDDDIASGQLVNVLFSKSRCEPQRVRASAVASVARGTRQSHCRGTGKTARPTRP